MDKVIEIVMVATVLLISAAVVLTMLNSEAEGFSDFLGEQSDSAKCDLWATQEESERPPEASECDNIDYELDDRIEPLEA